MKKISSIIYTFMFVFFSVIALGKTSVRAADVKPIQVNQKITDAVVNNENWYSFTTPERGYFTIDFSSVNPISDGDWTVILKDSNSKDIAKFPFTRGFTSVRFSNHIGDVFYVSVQNRLWVSGVDYNLTVNYYPDSSRETEYNDSEATATVLPINTNIYGAIEKYSDKDVYKIIVPSQKGYLNVSLDHDNVTETGEWSVTLITSDGKTVDEAPCSKSFNSGMLGYKPGTVLYLKVTSAWQTHQIYKVRVDFTPNDFFELEGDDSQEEAIQLSAGVEYTGILDGHRGECDWYSFVVGPNSKTTIEFGPKDVSSTGYWLMSFVDSNGKSYDFAYTSTKLSKTVNLKSGTYYLKVYNSSGAVWKLYNLKFTSTPIQKVKTPKIKKVSIKNNLFSASLRNIKMSKSIRSDVYYEVKISTKKNMKKPILVTSANSAKNIKSFEKNMLNKKNVYYVQVRPYFKDYFGDVVYVGNKSNVYKAKPKKN